MTKMDFSNIDVYIKIEDFRGSDVYEKIYRAKDYLTNNKGDAYGYLLESDIIDNVYMDGTGVAPAGYRPHKSHTSFRPALSIYDNNLILYNMESYHRGSLDIIRKHNIMP